MKKFFLILFFSMICFKQGHTEDDIRRGNDLKESSRQFVIRYGKLNPVCQDVFKTIKTYDRERHGDPNSWFVGWKKVFNNIQWTKDFYEIPSPMSGKANWPYFYAYTNINNAGEDEAVVLQTFMFRSQEMDKLHILDRNQFDKSRNEGSVKQYLFSSPSVDIGNGILFSNKQESVPVDIQIWEYQAKRYMLFREIYFGVRKERPNSFFVATISQDSLKRNPEIPPTRFVFDMVCQFQYLAK